MPAQPGLVARRDAHALRIAARPFFTRPRSERVRSYPKHGSSDSTGPCESIALTRFSLRTPRRIIRGK
jgi:hypothetical protein